MVETMLLVTFNFETLIATKPVVLSGQRRAVLLWNLAPAAPRGTMALC